MIMAISSLLVSILELLVWTWKKVLLNIDLEMQSFLKVRVACWDLDEKAAVQVVCELEEQGGTGLPIKVMMTTNVTHNYWLSQLG